MSEKMWAGRSDGITDAAADDFNSSLHFDRRMYRQDIRGSMAHAAMLAARGILSQTDADEIIEGLAGILADLDGGRLDFSAGGEDIHMFVETELTKRIGDAGKRLHTARSRNDQVALDLRMWLRDECAGIRRQVLALLEVIADLAARHRDTILPGYTHLQRAQPITFGHHLMAYGMMLSRDEERLCDGVKRMNFSPLGCCALAGTTYPTDREMTASALGFSGICRNSLDGVSDRDFCVEILSDLSILMMHLSRFAEEMILWSSWEFRFIQIDDAYTTGSSIMPQKKNPDMAELVRGKTGRVYGDLMGTLTMLKGLPLAYNKDMQEDKEAIFDGVDTVKQCLRVFTPMLKGIRVDRERMLTAAKKGFINATDLADYLVGKGMPFRSAYKITGQLVARCETENTDLEALPLTVYEEYSPLFGEDLYEAISLEACVRRRASQGGTCAAEVDRQVQWLREWMEHEKEDLY